MKARKLFYGVLGAFGLGLASLGYVNSDKIYFSLKHDVCLKAPYKNEVLSELKTRIMPTGFSESERTALDSVLNKFHQATGKKAGYVSIAKRTRGIDLPIFIERFDLQDEPRTSEMVLGNIEEAEQGEISKVRKSISEFNVLEERLYLDCSSNQSLYEEKIAHALGHLIHYRISRPVEIEDTAVMQLYAGIGMPLEHLQPEDFVKLLVFNRYARIGGLSAQEKKKWLPKALTEEVADTLAHLLLQRPLYGTPREPSNALQKKIANAGRMIQAYAKMKNKKLCPR